MVYDLFEEMARIRHEMDRMFHGVLGSPRYAPAHTAISGGEKGAELRRYTPARTDIKETAHEIIAAFDVPGVDKNDIQIDITNEFHGAKPLALAQNSLFHKLAKCEEREATEASAERCARNPAGFLSTPPFRAGDNTNPRTDLWNNKCAAFICSSERRVCVTEDTLQVKAERKAETKEENEGYSCHERSYSGFYRAFALPAEVVPGKATADYHDGVLTVTMPKARTGNGQEGTRVKVA